MPGIEQRVCRVPVGLFGRKIGRLKREFAGCSYTASAVAQQKRTHQCSFYNVLRLWLDGAVLPNDLEQESYIERLWERRDRAE